MKIELTSYTRYYSIEDDEGNDYVLMEEYDANSESIDYEIMVDGESLDDAAKRVRIISAFLSHQMNTQQ